jgi:hypothetical protein
MADLKIGHYIGAACGYWSGGSIYIAKAAAELPHSKMG